MKSKRRKFNGIHQPIVINPEELYDDRKYSSAGQPSKYLKDPERYRMLLIFFMSQGMIKEAASIKMGIAPMTLWNWQQHGKDAQLIKKEERTPDEHEWVEFLCTLNEGELYRQIWWEEKGRQGILSKEFNSTLWMMNMSNLFRNPEQDKIHNRGWVRDTGKFEVKGNVTHTPAAIDLTKFDRDEKELFLELVRKATAETITI